ncbi:MAG: methylated-DNA--[protein]-cysteine S-methyltransferase [Actinobacteria bacterium]|nr:methylated-DNA--[protein]-cysteine S-methyltransferase [Actinomycetota bacterium]
MKNIFYYKTSIGRIGISEKDGRITNLFFTTDSLPDDYIVTETDILKAAGKQLQEYLACQRKAFNLPFAPSGTVFMKNVWKCLQDIPYGTTQSYKEIALKIGDSNACRAVGLANNKNPIPVFIPCHRVIGANGDLTGYRGGLEIKSYLLNLEKQNRK